MNIDLWELQTKLTDLGIDVPEWVDQDITGYDIAGIVQGGCESGAYMPAVTYATALDTMNEHGDDVLEYLADLDAIALEVDSWGGIAVKLLSAAVEQWANQAEEEITEKLEDEVEQVQAQWPDIKAAIIEQYDADDEIALDQGFNDWTDSLCKDGTISDYTYSNITREDVE